MNSTVKDVMSTHVIAVRQGAPYKDMAAMLHEQRVSAFPVLDDDNKVIGVVSEADLLTKEALEGTVPRTLLSLRRSACATGERAHGGRADDQAAGDHRPRRAGYPRGPPDVRPAGQAAPGHQRRRKADRHRVPRRPAERVQPAGADIQQQITQDLILGTFLCDPDRFTVTVKDGIVTIAGTPETSVVGLDIIDAIRHMEGVVAVRDRLSYPQDTAVPSQDTQLTVSGTRRRRRPGISDRR